MNVRPYSWKDLPKHVNQSGRRYRVHMMGQHVGAFATVEEAEVAACKAEAELQGEFGFRSRLSVVTPPTD
jgi:hypothetical protein